MCLLLVEKEAVLSRIYRTSNVASNTGFFGSAVRASGLQSESPEFEPNNFRRLQLVPWRVVFPRAARLRVK